MLYKIISAKQYRQTSILAENSQMSALAKRKETNIMNEKITEMLDTTIETLRRINTDARSIFNIILNI